MRLRHQTAKHSCLQSLITKEIVFHLDCVGSKAQVRLARAVMFMVRTAAMLKSLLAAVEWTTVLRSMMAL